MRADDVLDAPCFRAPDLADRDPGEVVRLPPEEARHARVLRVAKEAPIRLTDGAGTLWGARFRPRGGRAAEARLERRLRPPPRLPLQVAFAVGSKTHTLWLVEKATELGVSRLRPLESRHSRSVADAARSRGFWDKAEARALAALKQSGGAWLPGFEPVVPFEEALRPLPAGGGLLLDILGPPFYETLRAWDGSSELAVLAGPEGGLTGSERRAARAAGWRPARLAPSVLRFETAVVCAIAIVAARVDARERVTREVGPEPTTGEMP